MAAVSIITPVYNAAAFLEATIASVRAQTFTDWEWVLVDDGSTDGTRAILDRHAATDSRIRVLSQQNAGPSAARNRAMRAATGALFAFIDSDDLWEPAFLAEQVALLERHPDAALVTGNAWILGGAREGQPVRPIEPGTPIVTLDAMLEDETAIFIMTVFRRAVFDTIGGMDETQWTSEDYDFWIRAALAGFVFRRNPVPLGHYRQRTESLSHGSDVRMLRGILHTYAKNRPACAPGTAARRRLDAQVARFEEALLLAEAKTAMERRDVREAAVRLRALRARGGSALVGITAWLAEHLPAAALLAYRMRGWRPRLSW